MLIFTKRKYHLDMLIAVLWIHVYINNRVRFIFEKRASLFLEVHIRFNTVYRKFEWQIHVSKAYFLFLT